MLLKLTNFSWASTFFAPLYLTKSKLTTINYMKYYCMNFVPPAYIIQEGLLQNKLPNNID